MSLLLDQQSAFYEKQFSTRYVSNFEGSLEFYDIVLAELGLVRQQNHKSNGILLAEYGNGKSVALFVCKDPAHQKINAIKPIKDFFFVESREVVESFYKTALAAGASKRWIPEIDKNACCSACVMDPYGYSIPVKYDPTYRLVFVSSHHAGITKALKSLKRQVVFPKSPQNPDPFVEMQLAQFIYTLPGEELKKVADTPDRLKYWMHLRGFYTAVSVFWQANILKNKNHIFDELLDSQNMDKMHYDIISLRAKRFQALWKLIDRGNFCIQKMPIELGLNNSCNSSQELFRQILQREVKKDFEVCQSDFAVSKNDLIDTANLKQKLIKICEPYFSCSMEDLNSSDVAKRMWNEAQKWNSRSHDMKSAEKSNHRRLKSLSSQLPINKLLSFCLLVCTSKSRSDDILRGYLYEYLTAIDQEAAVTKTALSRKRGSKTYDKPRSIAWKNGEIGYASPHGGGYIFNKTS